MGKGKRWGVELPCDVELAWKMMKSEHKDVEGGLPLVLVQDNMGCRKTDGFWSVEGKNRHF